MFDERLTADAVCLVQKYYGTAGGKNYSGKINNCELIFKLSGKTHVFFDGMTFEEQAYSLRYLPVTEKSVEYTVDTKEAGECIDIYFTPGEYSCNRAFVINFKDNEKIKSLFRKIHSVWKGRADGYYHKSMAILYDILAELDKEKGKIYCNKENFDRIIPAVEYLRENMFSPGLDCSELHTLCGIGYTRFKELFCAKFGMPPSRYVISERLSAACEMLAVGHAEVKEIANTVGYEDACYFSRLFKREMGCTALEYRHNAVRKNA